MPCRPRGSFVVCQTPRRHRSGVEAWPDAYSREVGEAACSHVCTDSAPAQMQPCNGPRLREKSNAYLHPNLESIVLRTIYSTGACGVHAHVNPSLLRLWIAVVNDVVVCVMIPHKMAAGVAQQPRRVPLDDLIVSAQHARVPVSRLSSNAPPARNLIVRPHVRAAANA
eukprot:COSAG01_NODE_208_length_21996_cov_31.972097_19_plen_168_part_00